MTDLTNKLMNLKEIISDTKTNKAKLEGRLSSLLERLKKDFDCNNLKEAETKHKSLTKEIQTKESELESGVEELDGIL